MLPALHRIVSRIVLKRRGYSTNVQRIVGQTSQWPDWYRWKSHAEHAGTPNDKHAMPIDPHGAAQKCSNTLKSFLDRIGSSKPHERYVWLGFALHCVQDLATHKGMTNAEHLYRGLRFWENPDYRPSTIRAGTVYSLRLLTTIERRLDPPMLEGFRKGDGVRKPSKDEVHALLGQKDISFPRPSHVVRTLWAFVRADHAARIIRWDCERVLSEGGIRDDGVLPRLPIRDTLYS